jgi:hypothetical protein
MTTEQIKAKIAKKEAKIAELKMQLAGAALQNLGKAIADHLKNQPQPKEFASGGYVAPKDEDKGDSPKLTHNDIVINRVKPKPFPPTTELLQANHDSLYNWTTDKVKSIEDRLDKIEMIIQKTEWTFQETPESTTCELSDEFKKRLYTNSTGSAKSCKTDQCKNF